MRITITIDDRHGAFLNRKKRELKRLAILAGKEHEVTESKIIQGLLEVWMSWDVKERDSLQHKSDGRKIS